MEVTGDRDREHRAQLGALRHQYRERVWNELLKVGKPDSRFHWDLSLFIPDFVGSERCVERVMGLDAFDRTGQLFITPDNSTEALRRQAIVDGRPFVMSTYGIQRGFLRLEPGRVPAGEERYAATLDGMDTYGEPVGLAELVTQGTFSLLVTGGSVVSRNGVRFGKGHGYFDLEWAILSEIGCTDRRTEIVDVVHDCQVVDDEIAPAAHDVPVDWIITPSATLAVPLTQRPPGRVDWALLSTSEMATIPPIEELRRMTGAAHG